MKFTTRNNLALAASLSLMATTTTAFVVVSKSSHVASRTNSGSCSDTRLFAAETEIEKLLRMARELRAQAEESEKEVVEKRADSNADKETRLGGLLNHLFYDGSKGHDVGKPSTAINKKSVVVEKLKSKNPSVDTLEKFVDWLDDRRDLALGNEQVQTKTGGTFAYTKGKKDDAEAERLNKLTDQLLDALEVIDAEANNRNGHLGGGTNAKDLRRRLRGKRRERDEQFLERQKSFVDAQTVKEGSKYEYKDASVDDSVEKRKRD